MNGSNLNRALLIDGNGSADEPITGMERFGFIKAVQSTLRDLFKVPESLPEEAKQEATDAVASEAKIYGLVGLGVVFLLLFVLVVKKL